MDTSDDNLMRSSSSSDEEFDPIQYQNRLQKNQNLFIKRKDVETNPLMENIIFEQEVQDLNEDFIKTFKKFITNAKQNYDEAKKDNDGLQNDNDQIHSKEEINQQFRLQCLQSENIDNFINACIRQYSQSDTEIKNAINTSIWALGDGSIIQQQLFNIKQFDRRYQNKKFILLSDIMAAMSSSDNLIGLSKQLNQQIKIRDFINQTQQYHLRLQNEQLQFQSQQPIFDFRFGDKFKYIFSGYKFEYISKIILAISAFKQGHLTLNFDGEYFKIMSSPISLNQNVYSTFINQLQIVLDTSYDSLFQTNIVQKLPFSVFCANGILSISKNQLQDIFIEEINQIRKRDPLFKLISFECENEIIFAYILSNIVNNDYVPLAYVITNYLQAYFSHQMLITGFHYFLPSSTQDNDFFQIKRIFFSADFDAYSPLFAQSLPNKHTALSKLKQYYELKYDLYHLIIVHSYKSENREFIQDFEQHSNANNYVELFSILFDKMTLPPSDINLSIDINNIDKIIRIQSKRCLKQLIMKYITCDLTFTQIARIYKFINSGTNLMILKSIDPSKTILKFQKLNLTLLQFLQLVPKLTSRKKLLEKELQKGLNIEQLCIQEQSQYVQYTLNDLNQNKAHMFTSEDARQSFVKKVDNEMDILQNTACFATVQQKFIDLNEQMRKILRQLDDEGLNMKVFDEHKFQLINGKRFMLHRKTLNLYKGHRRLTPENTFDFQQMRKIYNLIDQMHWKVQNGLFTWFCIYVEGEPYEKIVLQFLKELGIKKICTRVAALKFFGLISNLFKLVKETQICRQAFKDYFKAGEYQILHIPSEIFVDIECIFGLTDMSRGDDRSWDKNFIKGLYDWLNKESGEIYQQVAIGKEFELSLDRVLYDMKNTFSKYSLQGECHSRKVLIYVDEDFFLKADNFIYKLYGTLGEEILKQYQLSSIDDHISYDSQYQPYYDYSNNFFNFSATGSAQGYKLNFKETEQFNKLREVDEDNYEKIRQAHQRNKPEVSENQKSVSKTLCFAVCGKALPRILYWVQGSDYIPTLNLTIKREAKKIRFVINADLVSFVKQSYLYDWITKNISYVQKSKINSLLSTEDRLQYLYDMQQTYEEGKWCVPVDLKDFHFQFGKSHFDAFCDILLSRVSKTVKCKYIQNDLQRILFSCKHEFSSGILNFFLQTDEENLFLPHMKNSSNVHISCKENIHKIPNPKYKEKNVQSSTQQQQKEEGLQQAQQESENVPQCDNTQKQEGEEEEEFKEKKLYTYRLKMKMNNGLMSGWKMTSIFGSVFNLALNYMSSRFSLMENGDLLTDLNVLGDDTHFKRRYLVSSINHICFINMMNKLAHPEKQLVSQVSTEFLKKRIDTINHSTTQSSLRALNSLLLHKDQKINAIRTSSYLKDNIDQFNLFLYRLNNQTLIQKILRKGLFFKFFQQFMGISNKKMSEVKDDVLKILNSPCFYSGVLGGPLRSLFLDHNQHKINIESDITKYDVKTGFKIYELDLNNNQCNGIIQSIGKLLHGFKNMAPEQQFNSFMAIFSTTELEEIKKDVGEFHSINFDPLNNRLLEKNTFPVDFIKIDPNEDVRYILGRNNPLFDIENFIEYSLALIEENLVKGFSFSGIIGQLIYKTERLSSKICQVIKTIPLINGSSILIIRELMKLQPNSQITTSLIKRFSQNYGEANCLNLAIKKDYEISVSRYFGNDESIGYLNYILSKTLLFYLIEHPSEVAKNSFDSFMKLIVISLDYYLHDHHQAIIQRLNNILAKRHLQA